MIKLEFDKVYAENKEKVWRLVSRYAFAKQDREDLFQEVFLKIHKALPKFRGEAKFETWIFRITANTSINYVNKQKRYAALKAMLDRFVSEETAEVRETPEICLSKPLDKLNAQQRMILVLAEVEERKLDEISKMLDLPVGTVKSNLHRAREILRKELENNDKLQ